MKCLVTSLIVGMAMLAGCAPIEDPSSGKEPSEPAANGDDASANVAPDPDAGAVAEDTATEDTATKETTEVPGHNSPDAALPSSANAWKPGQKIPADQFWPSGTDGLALEWHQMFSAYRSRPTTSAWIDVHWIAWDWITWPGLLSTVYGDEHRVLVWEDWKDFKGIMAMAMSMAGSDNVDYADYDKAMYQCANGEFDEYWKTFARQAKASGRNGSNTIISLAQEFNGTWFPWNPKRTSMETWMSCWKRTYTAIHSESDLQVAWVFSATAHTTIEGDYAVASVWDAYPGDDYVDVVGLTRYDFKTLGPIDSTDWRDTCWNTQDICHTAKLAREHGKKLAVVEWSIERGKYGYGDNPNFVQMMFGFFADNRDILLLENHFDNYGDGDWSLFPRADNNAKSSDKYKELYTP
jgi:Glycosyl hydrolase family 26